MRKVLSLIFFTLGSAAGAQTPDIQVSDYQTQVGIPIFVRMEMQGVDSLDVNANDGNEYWKVVFLGGEPQSFIQSTTINGRTTTSSKKSWTGTWQMIPLRSGRWSIPDLQVKYQGKALGQNLGSVEVLPLTPNPNFYVTQKVEAFRMVLGQSQVLTLEIGVSEQINSILISFPIMKSQDWEVTPETLDPNNTNFGYIKLPIGNQEITFLRGQKKHQGINFTTLTAQFIIRAQKTGLFSIPEALVSFSPRNSLRNTYSLAVQSEAIKIEVEDLPLAGRPNPFSGLIGNIKIQQSLETLDLHVGDPVGFQLTLEGAVNFKEIDRHKLVSELLPSEDWAIGEEKILGPTASRWILRPKRPGQLEIPGLQLNYYDPVKGSYLLTRGPQTVAKVQGTAQDSHPSESSKQVQKLNQITIEGQKTLFLSPDSLGTPFWLFWIPGPGVLLIFLGLRWAKISERRIQKRFKQEAISLIQEILQDPKAPELWHRWKTLMQSSHGIKPEKMKILESSWQEAKWSGKATWDLEPWSQWLQELKGAKK